MPVDKTSEIIGAVSDRAFWGNFVDVATVVVIVGAALESIAEIPFATKLFSLTEHRRRWVESLGFWILLIGLCGEFAFGIPVANDTATIETKLGARVTGASQLADSALTTAAAAGTAAQDAKTNAATAIGQVNDADVRLRVLSDNEENLKKSLSRDSILLNHEKKARSAMIAQLAPREITERQEDILVNAIRGKYTKMYIFVKCDGDAISFSSQLGYALEKAGVKTYGVFANPLDSGKSWCWDNWPVPVSIESITVAGDDNTVKFMMETFSKAGILMNGTHVGTKIPTPALLVGAKPEPFFRMPEIYLTPEAKRAFRNRPPPWAPAP